MKFSIPFVLVISLLSFASCSESDTNYPMSTGTVVVDSLPRVEATTGTLTIAYLTGRVTSSGYLPVDRGLFISDSIHEIHFEDSLALRMNADRKIPEINGGAGKFNVKVTLLKAKTWYYYRFYVVNDKGMALSPIDSFFSAPTLPRLSIQPATVLLDTAYFAGALTGNGGEAVYEKGFVYSLGQLPIITDVDNVVKLTMPDTLVAPFTAKVSGLLKNRKYYVRTYAKNRGGTNYSGQQIFTTNP